VPIEDHLHKANLKMRKDESVDERDLKIVKIEVPDPEYQSEIPPHWKQNNFPGFPSTTLVCGPPGRGKTNLLMNLLKNKKMWNGFFDEIYAYGPTVKADKLYKTIKLKPQNIVDDVKKVIPDLESKLKTQTEKVESNAATAPKCLFLFEDMTSFFNTIQHKPEFHRCYTQVRHLKGASITMVHKYHAFNRTPRTSSQHIIIFETNKADIKHVYTEFGPRTLDINDFMLMVDYALTPTKDSPKPFLYINTMVEDRLRFRKNFTEIMEILPSRLTIRPGSSGSMGRKRSNQRRRQRRRSRSRSPEPDDAFGKSFDGRRE